MDEVVEALRNAWDAFSTPLRMREGFSPDRYQALRSRLEDCAAAWQGKECLPRVAVNILVDILPSMEAGIHLYGDAQQEQIREATYSLQELIWECVAVDVG